MHRKVPFLVLFVAVFIWLGFNYLIISIGMQAQSKQPKHWYAYGLIYKDAFDQFQNKLEPYGIKLEMRGCIVGGDQYRRDMINNQIIFDAASPELKLVLGRRPLLQE